MIEEEDWSSRYEAMRRMTRSTRPGYMIHEAALWYKPSAQWIFLPRKVSTKPYDSNTDDPHVGGSIMIKVSDDFTRMSWVQVGENTPGRGFSTVKLLPGHPARLVAIRTEEVVVSQGSEVYRSYLTVLDLAGNVYMNDTLISAEIKFEGIALGRLQSIRSDKTKPG